MNNTSDRAGSYLFVSLVSLGRYDSTSVGGAASGNGSSCTEDETMRQIMKQESTASGVLCWLNSRRETELGLTDDVLGFVAALGRVEDENLSRFLFLIGISFKDWFLK